MKYIESMREGEKVSDIYLCKHRISAVTKNGKAYESVILQDKTGTVDGKIWDPNSQGIGEFDALDYVDVVADIISFNGALQLNIKRIRKVSDEEYNPADYLPVSAKNIDSMFEELKKYIDSVQNQYFRKLLNMFFSDDAEFIKVFKAHSAAKSVHHSFVGGLLEHTLSVTKLCDYYAKSYTVLNRDLLITSAIFHDIGKVRELAAFPINDYTDDGQLLGHIMIGAEMISEKIAGIEDFPKKQASELKHCILAHHGELEYGSPKKPSLAEALALNLADNTDAKLETMTEIINSSSQDDSQWIGYNRFFESNIRKTSK